MAKSTLKRPRPRLLAQIAALLALSVVFELALEMIHIPAALLLGPMLGGIVVAVMRAELKIPGPCFMVGQAVIGCMIARTITPEILREILKDWPIFLAGVLAVVAASNGLGWLLARFRVLPGSTAIWGSSPGGASAMVLMAGAFGADIRLVAFMQYLRVVFVALVASGLAVLTTGGAPSAGGIVWFPPVHPVSLGETLALAGAGVAAGRWLPIPAGPVLVPLFLGAALHGAGAMTIDLPQWLLAGSYAVVGWAVGFRFDRAILRHAARALPRVALSIFVLIGLCGALAWLLAATLHLDPLTAYLATSPGGVDSVAIIAASSHHVDIAFVMAMQTARLIIVIVGGPHIARFAARSLPADGKS